MAGIDIDRASAADVAFVGALVVGDSGNASAGVGGDARDVARGSADMLIDDRPDMGGRSWECSDPFNGAPEVVTMVDSGEAEVGGLGAAAAATVDAIARATPKGRNGGESKSQGKNDGLGLHVEDFPELLTIGEV